MSLEILQEIEKEVVEVHSSHNQRCLAYLMPLLMVLMYATTDDTACTRVVREEAVCSEGASAIFCLQHKQEKQEKTIENLIILQKLY